MWVQKLKPLSLFLRPLKDSAALRLYNMDCIAKKLNLIVAFSSSPRSTFAIGKNNTIPWKISEDLCRFKQLTEGHVVVMGRTTFESMGSKPLPNRINYVITSHGEDIEFRHSNLKVGTLEHVINWLVQHEKRTDEIWVIGGERVYEHFAPYAQYIYTTHVEKEVPNADVFFPIESLRTYEIHEFGERLYSDNENCSYRYVTYKNCFRGTNHHEGVYLNLVKDIMRDGSSRSDRTQVGTLSVFSRQIRFDISKTVPFLTTKQLAWKAVLKELVWFLKGSTDSKELEKQGVNIWKGNTSREFLDKRGLTDYREGDLGPMYFYQIYHWGAPYEGCDADYEGKGYDQMENLLKGLIDDPYSRRHLLTTYNPADVKASVLAPCHGVSIMFYVETHEDSVSPELSCHVVIRSSDVALGLPFNIASYTALTYVIAKKVGMTPKDLVISTGDTHIYNNACAQLRTQLVRTALPPPVLLVSDAVAHKSIRDVTLDDFELVGYVSHPPIKMEMAV
jgi:thymidylate synthase